MAALRRRRRRFVRAPARIPGAASVLLLGLVVATAGWAHPRAPRAALGPAHPVSHRLQLAPTGEAAGDQFGIVVGGPGDLNGDGYADFVVDGFLNDFAGNDAGRAYVFFGGPLLSLKANVVLTGSQAGANFGVAKGAGDVNGDGYPDVIVGANEDGERPIRGTGKAFIYFGGPAMDSIPDVVLSGENSGDLFGSRVAGVGDVNGDGYDDVIVGAIGWGARTGRAYLYYGGPDMDSIPDLVFTGQAAGDEFGLVARGGDVNSDGYPDVIVGAWLADAGGLDAGRAYLYFGGPGMHTTPDRIFTGEGTWDRFGVSVMGTGDINGDGFDDLIVGAYWNDAGGTDAGRVYIYYGSAAMDTIADVVLTGQHPDDGFGKSVCDAGDVNGDGYADVIIGAYTSDTTGVNSGCGYLYYGGPSMDTQPDMIFPGEASYDQLGYWVAGVGDVNGDGFGDVVIGASFNDAGAVDAGRAYLIDFNRYFVTSPNGGEMWAAGGEQTVAWRGAEPADVWLSLDGGATFQRVLTGAGGNESNTATVDVPMQPTNEAIVKITPTDTGVNGEDRSDAPFSIVVPAAARTPASGAPAFAVPWPNPATSAIQLALDVPLEARVRVSAMDLQGRTVATPLEDARQPAGRLTRLWRPGALPSGIYRLRARIGDAEIERSIVWLGGR